MAEESLIVDCNGSIQNQDDLQVRESGRKATWMQYTWISLLLLLFVIGSISGIYLLLTRGHHRNTYSTLSSKKIVFPHTVQLAERQNHKNRAIWWKPFDISLDIGNAMVTVNTDARTTVEIGLAVCPRCGCGDVVSSNFRSSVIIVLTRRYSKPYTTWSSAEGASSGRSEVLPGDEPFGWRCFGLLGRE
ncbi:hypothetical protein FQR65_LT07908 [Abscondita terminalis]|nr:hypothetical protein FQR65_LT07908 [Abscondita terminalis]